MNKALRKLRRSLLPAALLLACSMPALAQDAPPGQEVSAEAKAVLERMTTYMKGLQAYTIQAHGTRDEVIDHGFKLQHNETASLQVQRPNKMRAVVSGDLRNREFVYDGATITIDSPDDNVYATTPATDNLGTLIGDLLDRGVELPLIDVLYQATAGTLLENVRTGQLVGDSESDVSVHVLGPAFRVERDEIDRRAGLASRVVGASQLVLEEVTRELTAVPGGVRSTDPRGRQCAADGVDGVIVQLPELFGRAAPVADVRLVPGLPVPLFDFGASVLLDAMPGPRVNQVPPFLVVGRRVRPARVDLLVLRQRSP